MQNKAPRSAWFALWILFGINTMNFYDRQIMGAVAEMVRKDWALSDTMLGTLGTAFILIYAIVGLPLGRLADIWSRRKVLGIGVGVWSLLTAASGLAPNIGWMFATRIGVGVGEASCAPAANSLVGDLFPPRQRALALSIFMLGLPIGVFFCYRISGLIAQAYSWREAFYFACIPGLILSFLAFRLPEPARGGAEVIPTFNRRRAGSPYLVVLGIPTILWIIISGALHNFNAYAINSFMPSYLMRTHLMSVKQASNISSIVLGAVGVVGMVCGGLGADYLGRRWANGKLLLPAIGMLLAAPCIYLALNQPPGATVSFMLLMGFGWCFTYIYYASVYASIQDVVEPALRGTAMALYFFAMYVLGASFGPVITGMMSDHFAKKAMLAAGASTMTEQFKGIGLHQAMYIIPVLCLILAAVLFMASSTIKKDIEKLRVWQKEGTVR